MCANILGIVHCPVFLKQCFRDWMCLSSGEKRRGVGATLVAPLGKASVYQLDNYYNLNLKICTGGIINYLCLANG
jgi:hypothetical protein